MVKEITVLAFGAVADVLGKNYFTLAGAASTNDVVSHLEQEFPALKNIRYALAVNKQTVTADTALTDAATVALLPPFSGG